MIESLHCRRHPGIINEHLAYDRGLLQFLYLLRSCDGLETLYCEVTIYKYSDVWATASEISWLQPQSYKNLFNNIKMHS